MAQLWSILPRMAKFSLCGSLRIEGVEGYVLFTRFGISPPPKPGKSYHSARDVDGAKHSEPQDHLPDAGGQPLQGGTWLKKHTRCHLCPGEIPLEVIRPSRFTDFPEDLEGEHGVRQLMEGEILEASHRVRSLFESLRLQGRDLGCAPRRCLLGSA